MSILSSFLQLIFNPNSNLLLILWLFCFLYPSHCFIPNELLGVASVTSKFHTEMTENAIIRHARDYFNSIRGSTGPEIQSLDPDELFKEFYGSGADSTSFKHVIDQIEDAVASIDSNKDTKKNPKWHFDSERIVEGHEHLIQEADGIVQLVRAEDYDSARQKLGRMLHPLQDFYSHTNWIELGNTDFNRNLGVKGQKVGEVAGPDEQTCKDCEKDFSSRLKSGALKFSLVGLFLGKAGGDEDNIYNCDGNIVTKKLTSGYSVNQKDDSGAPVTKPENVGKCSHGGTLDGSSGEFATGGVNKDGHNSLFSPHDYLHTPASDMAENATVFYLDYLQKQVGDDLKWSRFLQLLSGSSVAFVVDISGSMRPYVDGVKEKIRRTVAAFNQNTSAPSEYIFVPFSQTLAGPVYVRSTPAEVDAFLDAFNASENLDTNTTSDTRKLYEGAMLGAQRSTVGGVLYLITNGVPADSGMLPWFEDTLRKKGLAFQMRLASKLDGLRRRRQLGDTSAAQAIPPHYYNEYTQLAKATGGEVVIVDTEELQETLHLVTLGSRKSFILIAQASENATFTVPVDTTIKSFELTVHSNDNLPQIRMTDPGGQQIDPRPLSQGLLYSTYSINNPKPGSWKILADVTGEPYQYTIAAQAVSGLDLGVRLYYQDLTSDHPGLQSLNESPLENSEILVEFKPSIKGALYPVYIQTRDPNYKLIDQFSVQAGKTEGTWYSTIKVPSQPFYAKIYGIDSAGYPFMRTDASLIQPSTLFIEASKPRLMIEASDYKTPNKTRYLSDFSVENHGGPGLFTIKVWDTGGFTSLFHPDSGAMRGDETLEGQILFEIPSNQVGVTTDMFIKVNNFLSGASNTYQDSVVLAN